MYEMELQADKVVLSFHDSLLRVSDVNLLTAGRWLNDKIVSFTFECVHYCFLLRRGCCG